MEASSEKVTTVIACLLVSLIARPAFPKPSNSQPWAFFVSAMTKAGPKASFSRNYDLTLFGARGECVAAQLVIPTPIQKLEAQTLPLAQKPPSSVVTLLHPVIYREDYLLISTPSNIEGSIGKWPDPLIPQRDFYDQEIRNAFPASYAGPEPIVLYYEVCIPISSSPGTFIGNIALTAHQKKKLNLPVKVKVRKFALPATSSLPNSFGFSGWSAAHGHRLNPTSSTVNNLTRKYSIAALKHRISFHGMTMEPPPPGSDSSLIFDAYDQELAPFLDGTALPNGARFTSVDVRMHPSAKTDQQKIAYLRKFTEHLRKRNWFSRAFVYAYDEPKLEHLPLVKHIAKLAHQADPDLRVLVTSPLHPLLEPFINVFAPNLNCLFSRPASDYCALEVPLTDYQKIRKNGVKLWWYQSCGSHSCTPIDPHDLPHLTYFSGWASYMVDHDAFLNRAMGVLAFLNGIDGELYFNTVQAYLPEKENQAADPWKSVWRFHGNGDGTLFYPGTPRQIGGTTHIPVESLRLKYIRDGLQDYEYLVLARSLGLDSEARSVAHALAPKPYQISKDTALWTAKLQWLAERIEQALSK